MAKYRIISLDGGGIKGIITAILLKRLTLEPGLENLLYNTDLIAGTSTGGLLALGISYGLDVDTIISLYKDNGKEIFDDSWLDDVVDVGKITGADYDIEGLTKILKRIFGEKKLSGLKKKVLIATFDLDNEDPSEAKRMWKPKLFHNFPGSDSDGSELAYRVGLYTSAAPTYFPSVDGYVDGGVYANNPSMCALAQSQDERVAAAASLAEVILLSMGTGISLYYIKGKTHDWGYAQWAKPLVNLMLDGISGIADYQCRQILGSRYHRLAPVFPPKISVPMDAVDKIPYMMEFAAEVDLTDTITFLKEKWI